jgi:hypothetical protein
MMLHGFNLVRLADDRYPSLHAKGSSVRASAAVSMDELGFIVAMYLRQTNRATIGASCIHTQHRERGARSPLPAALASTTLSDVIYSKNQTQFDILMHQLQSK